MKIDILAEKRAQEKAAKLAKRLAVVKHFESLTDDTYILSELKMIVHKINRPSNKPGKLTPQQYAEKRERQNSVQSRTKEKALSHGRRWTASEDDAVLHSGEIDEQIAINLGRTHAAVNSRRATLLRRDA